MKDLNGTVVFITGGAQGIGLGMARAFVLAGSTVALADLDQPALAAAEQELSELSGDRSAVATFALDVRDRAEFARIVDAVEDRLGPISVLCNNAGIGSQTAIDDLSYETWDQVLGINVGGVVNGVQSVLPRMLERGGPGHIVNTASAAGLVPNTNLTYTTSKFAVVGLSESLRRQAAVAAKQIGVTVVCPGLVRTDVMRHSAEVEGRPDADVEEAQAGLQQYGLDPDVVGEQVLAAVRADELYVQTDRTMVPMIEARTEALLAALPEETERDRELVKLFQEARARMQEPPASNG